MHQALGGGGVAAVGNDDLAVRVAVAFELQHDALESAVLAAGLQRTSSSPTSLALPMTRMLSIRATAATALHPAIPGQIRQRFQREQQMGVVTVAQHLFADVVKLPALLDERTDMLCQQHQLRAGRQAVQHKDLSTRVLCLILFCGQLGGVAAARQGAGDGDGINFICAS